MWEAGWAGDIAWFQFGKRVTRPHPRGGQREVGEYALHISCAWTWRTESGFVRADEDSTDLTELGGLQARVESSSAEPSGHLKLLLSEGECLEVEPDEPTADPANKTEYWRLFQPGLRTPHMVSSNLGIHWHEA